MAALVLAGCSGGQGPAIGPGPLAADIEPGRSWQCVPADPAGQYAIGVRVFSNPARQNAVLTGVELVGGRGLRLVDAVVLPVDRMATGAQPSWTPTGVEPARWARAVPLDGGGYVPTDWTERGQRLAHELQAEVGDSFVVVYDP